MTSAWNWYVILFPMHRAIDSLSNVLLCIKVTADACPGSIQPYRLCDDVGGYVDAVMRWRVPVHTTFGFNGAYYFASV